MIQWNQELYHYGIPRRSGRYKWGSGKNPFHHGSFIPRKVKNARDNHKAKIEAMTPEERRARRNRNIKIAAGIGITVGAAIAAKKMYDNDDIRQSVRDIRSRMRNVEKPSDFATRKTASTITSAANRTINKKATETRANINSIQNPAARRAAQRASNKVDWEVRKYNANAEFDFKADPKTKYNGGFRYNNVPTTKPLTKKTPWAKAMDNGDDPGRYNKNLIDKYNGGSYRKFAPASQTGQTIYGGKKVNRLNQSNDVRRTSVDRIDVPRATVQRAEVHRANVNVNPHIKTRKRRK